MLTEERHQRILALLEETDIVKVSELIHQLQASESTIRRDLQELEAQGVLVKHAALLIDQGIETLILGGTIKISTNAVLGSGASEQLRKLRFNRCFIGMNGAHVDAGFTTPDPEEAMIKKIAIENSQKAYVLLDHSKFQQTTFAQVAAIEDAEIITDFCPKNYAAKFRTQTTIMEVSE